VTFRPLRRTAAVVVGLGILAAATAVPAQAKTSSPQQWGKAFCGGLSDWADALTGIGQDIQSLEQDTSPADGQAAIIEVLGDMGDATGDFHAAMKKTGSPDTSGGDRIQKQILKGIKGIQKRIADMEALAEKLPTTDSTSFETAVQALAAGFDTVSTPFDRAMTKVASIDRKDELSDQLQDVKECKALF
jgi:hypothetical protein